MTEKEVIPFSHPFVGEVRVPGSKSLTNRIFPLAVLFSRGEKTHIKNTLESEDSEIMRKALTQMGAEIERSGGEKNDWEVSSGTFWKNTEDLEIFCGNSGTSIRFLAAIALLRKGRTVLTGIERMKERPIGDLGNALRQLGAEVSYLENEGFPPLRITPPPFLKNGKVSLNGSLSSQFLSAVLHILPFFEDGGEISIEGELVSKPYIEMTLSILREVFGVQIENNGFQRFSFFPSQAPHSIPKEIFIEPDASSASYPLALFAITGGRGKVLGIGENSVQGDAQFAKKALEKMGSVVEYSANGICVSAPKELFPLGEISLEDMPDVAMTAVILAAFANGYSKINGLSTLRHKECDRIFALASNLKKMGADIREGEDFLEIFGDPKVLHGALIDSFNDHRIAMCFAVLGSVILGVVIQGSECVTKTYPEFWEDLESWKKMGEENSNAEVVL